MNKIKLTLLSIVVGITMCETALAGGILTNTNQNVHFNRNFARCGTIGIDGVYSNPAGVAFMPQGLHISFNWQNAYQTRTINSGMTVPALQGTPFYQPFKMNGGEENGIKEFEGEASVPIIPSLQAVYNMDEHWGFQLNFSITGGGGKCTFNHGLGSFERTISMIPAMLHQQGLTGDGNVPAYSVSSYLSGRQYVIGLQLGATYKFNDHLAVYGGARFNYISNRYKGNITNISANIGNQMTNLYDYFGSQAESYKILAANYSVQASQAPTPEIAAQLTAAAEQCNAAAQKFDQSRHQFADRYLDCTQTGWGITPIIGVDFKWNKWNFGARLEFTNHLNIENDTERDDTGLFQDGVNTPGDLPGLFSIGAQYEILPKWRVMASYHYFFDKDAKMDKGKQKLLSGNTQEFLVGTEYDITDAIQVSVGGQRTKYGLGDGSFLSDMSFVTSSYSIGFGAGIQVSKMAKVNIAYFWTSYETFDKEYTEEMSAGGTTVTVNNTDSFTRTNKVLGVGVDLTF